MSAPVAPLQRLAALREQLEQTPAYPWANIEAWVARARPLVRTALHAHLEDFETLVKQPRWAAYAFVVSRSDRWGREPPRDNFEEASGSEERDNQQRAAEAKRKILAWLDGILEQAQCEPQVTHALERLTMLLDRFPLVIRSLSDRYNKRPPLVIADEYDLQYLLHAMLIGSFRDVRPEECTPSYAGGASRMDFLLKLDRLVLETKFVRAGHSDKSLTDELIVDKERYQSHSDCGALVCFVYDPEHRLRSPEALEADLRVDGEFSVIVIVRPR